MRKTGGRADKLGVGKGWGHVAGGLAGGDVFVHALFTSQDYNV